METEQINSEILTVDSISQCVPMDKFEKGQIIVVCNKAIHIIISNASKDEHTSVLTIADCSGGMLPNGIMVTLRQNESFKTLGFKTNNLLFLRNGFLMGTCGEPLIKIKGVRSWLPVCFNNLVLARYSVIRDSLEQTRLLCIAHAWKKGGLVFLLPVIKDIFIEHRQINFVEPFEKRALKNLLTFIDGIEHYKRSYVTQGAIGLVGLGPGLTPSGDDLIIGILAGLTAVAKCCSKFDYICILKKWIEPLIIGRTTVVSETLLLHALNNEFPEVLTDLVTVIVTTDKRLLHGKVKRTLSIGSSSGFDLTIGVILGVEIGLRMFLEN